MPVTREELQAKLTADDSDLLGKVKNSTTAVAALGATGAAAMATVGGGMTGAAMKTLNLGDSIAKTGHALDLTNEQTTRFQQIAKLTGVTVNGLAGAFSGYKELIDRGRVGTTAFNAELEKIGLTMDDLKGKNPEEQFNTLLIAMSKVDRLKGQMTGRFFFTPAGGKAAEPVFHRKDTAEIIKQAEGAGVKTESAETAEGVSNFFSRIGGKLKRGALEQAFGGQGVVSKGIAGTLGVGLKAREKVYGGLGISGFQSLIQAAVSIDNKMEELLK